MFKYLKQHFIRTMKSERGFLGALLGGLASGIGGSLMGNLFGGDEASAGPGMPAWQQQTGQQLAEFLKKYMGNYVPGQAYGGQLTAGATPQETSTLSILNKLLSSGTGDLFNQAKGVAGDTLSGKYLDVESSPLAKAMRASGARTLEDQLSGLAGNRAAMGNFFHTGTMRQSGDLATKLGLGLNTDIGNILQQERQNQLNMIPVANQMAEYETTGLPLKQIQAGQSFGALNRLLSQADMEAKYNEFKRQQGQLEALPGLAGGLYGQQSNYGYYPNLTQQNPLATMFGGALGQGVSSFFQPGGSFARWLGGAGGWPWGGGNQGPLQQSGIF